MTTTMRFATMTALMAGLVTMVHAARLVAAEPPQAAAPADLRELAGQAVPNERNLLWKHAKVIADPLRHGRCHGEVLKTVRPHGQRENPAARRGGKRSAWEQTGT